MDVLVLYTIHDIVFLNVYSLLRTSDSLRGYRAVCKLLRDKFKVIVRRYNALCTLME